MVRLELPIKILFLPLLAAFAGFVILGLWVASDGARSPGGVEASDVVDNIYAAIARCMNNSMFVSDVSFGEESRVAVTVQSSHGAGCAVEQNEAPLRGAIVDLVVIDTQGVVVKSVAGTTDVNGIFVPEVLDVPPGTYSVSVTGLRHFAYTWDPELDVKFSAQHTVLS